MAAGGYVVVPQKLADTLVADGFRKGGFRRGVDPLTALSAGVNLVSIFVARHEIARSAAHLEGFGDDGPPPEVVRGMTALLEAMTEFDRDQQGAIPGSGP